MSALGQIQESTLCQYLGKSSLSCATAASSLKVFLRWHAECTSAHRACPLPRCRHQLAGAVVTCSRNASISNYSHRTRNHPVSPRMALLEFHAPVRRITPTLPSANTNRWTRVSRIPTRCRNGRPRSGKGHKVGRQYLFFISLRSSFGGKGLMLLSSCHLRPTSRQPDPRIQPRKATGR